MANAVSMSYSCVLCGDRGGTLCRWNSAVFEWLSKKQYHSNCPDQITTGENQSDFLANTRNPLKAREESLVYGVIGFGFASQ